MKILAKILHLVAAAGAMASPVFAQTANFDALRSTQGPANSKPGARSTPAKVIAVPTDVDEGLAKAIAAPYSSLWDLTTSDPARWRAIVRTVSDKEDREQVQARAALGVRLETTSLGGVRAYILTPREIPDRHKGQVVFQLHGGGWVFGPGEAGTQEAAMLAAYGGYKVVAIDYRMPPDAPFPAGLDDVMAAWRALARDVDPRRIALQGTSAGGNLAFAFLLRAKREGLPLPAAVAATSPVMDLSFRGDTCRTHEWIDNVLVSCGGFLDAVVKLYARGHDVADPSLSPIGGDFRGLPPTNLTSGTRDLLLSDAARTQRKLREAGVEADLQVYEGMSHAQYLYAPTASVTKTIMEQVAGFFDKHLAR